jgi:hypothetical protein
MVKVDRSKKGEEFRANGCRDKASGSMLIARRLALPNTRTCTGPDRGRKGTLSHAAAITITPLGDSIST